MRNRISAISLVHQKLYQSKDLSNIDLGDYLNDLITLLIKSYSGPKTNINLKLEMENIPVLIDIAVPLGSARWYNKTGIKKRCFLHHSLQ